MSYFSREVEFECPKHRRCDLNSFAFLRQLKMLAQPEHYRHFLTRLVIGTVAVTHGLAGVGDLAISYLYKDEFSISPATFSILMTITNIAWVMKPIWGFTSDSFPICRMRRTPYLMGFSALSGILWIGLSASYSLALTVGILILNSICTAFTNVIAEALVVEESQRQGGTQSHAAKNVTFFFALRAVGYIMTSYLSGVLIENFSSRFVLLITCVFPFILLTVSWVLPEDPLSFKNSISLGTQCKEFSTFICRREMFMPVTFIYIFLSTPSTSDAMFFYYTNELGFSPEFMGRLRLAQGLAMLLGQLAYQWFLKNISFKQILTWSAVFYSLVTLSLLLLISKKNRDLGIPDDWFCYCSGFLSVVLAELNMMPILVLCARICPKNIEGTMYAFFMSTLNLGYFTSAMTSSGMMAALGITQTNFKNLWLMIVLCSIFLILPLPLLNCLKVPEATDEQSSEVKLVPVSTSSSSTSSPYALFKSDVAKSSE